MEIAAFVLMILVLGAAIFFWGRGIHSGRKSDLIAGPAILVALCFTLLRFYQSCAVVSLTGGFVFIFGVATLLLSGSARPGSGLSRGDLIAIGIGAITIGGVLTTILV